MHSKNITNTGWCINVQISRCQIVLSNTVHNTMQFYGQQRTFFLITVVWLGLCHVSTEKWKSQNTLVSFFWNCVTLCNTFCLRDQVLSELLISLEYSVSWKKGVHIHSGNMNILWQWLWVDFYICTPTRVLENEKSTIYKSLHILSKHCL